MSSDDGIFLTYSLRAWTCGCSKVERAWVLFS